MNHLNNNSRQIAKLTPMFGLQIKKMKPLVIKVYNLFWTILK